MHKESVDTQHLENLRRHIPNLGSRRILDVGSGRGRFLIKCAKQEISAVGLELNPEYIKITEKRARDAGARVEVVEGIAERMPFGDESFDFINCAEVTEHVEDLRQVFREFSRVLKKGGQAYVSAHNRWGARDSHFHLWGLNWMPRAWAERYIAWRARHKGYGQMPDRQRISEMSYFRWRNLVMLIEEFGFEITDIREKRLVEQFPRLVRPLFLLAYRPLRLLYFNTFHLLLTKRTEKTPPLKIAVFTSKPVMSTIGGKQAMTVNIVDVLVERYDVTLVTFDRRLNTAWLDSVYATGLGKRRFSLVHPYRWVPFIQSGRLWILRHHLLMRYAKNMRHTFDILFSASGELDLGKRGIQVIYGPTPNLFRRKVHSPAGRVNRALAFMASTPLIGRMKKNKTISISEWSQEETRKTYGIGSVVIYPPVHTFGRNPTVPWEERDDGVVCVARLTSEKRIEDAIEIVRRARESNPNLRLHLVGDEREPEYFAKIEQLVANYDWLLLHQRLTRAELEKLVTHNKYGISAMHNEHFGLSVAEFILGGAIPIVHNSGGQVEIVSNNERLTYKTTEEAVEKIKSLMSDTSPQKEIQAKLRAHIEQFLAPRFRKSILKVVEEFYESR